MKELVWSVFEKSGQIESYLLYKTLMDCQGEENEEADDGDSACEGCDTTLL